MQIHSPYPCTMSVVLHATFWMFCVSSSYFACDFVSRVHHSWFCRTKTFHVTGYAGQSEWRGRFILLTSWCCKLLNEPEQHGQCRWYGYAWGLTCHPTSFNIPDCELRPRTVLPTRNHFLFWTKKVFDFKQKMK